MISALDEKILAHLRGIHGSTAWAMRRTVGATREEVSRECQRLKRKGLVTNDGPYWQAVKP